jgi:hypothetical protein
MVKDVKKVEGNPIVVRLVTRADKIMITPRIAKSIGKRQTTSRRREQVSGIIQEIEIYGFASGSEPVATEEEISQGNEPNEQKKVVSKYRLEDLLEPVEE